MSSKAKKINTVAICAVMIEQVDNEVHINGLGFSSANTLCGITDDGGCESTDETPTCVSCIELYESIKQHRPRFKFN